MKARFVVRLLAAGALLVPAATASAAAAPSGSTGRAVAKSPTEAVWCTFQGEKPFQVTHNDPLYAQGHYTGCSTPAPDTCRAQVDLRQPFRSSTTDASANPESQDTHNTVIDC